MEGKLMEKIRPQAVAGMFYPENAEELRNQLEYFMQKNNCDYEYKSRAVIVPHAGYVYSGQLASEGFECLEKNVKNIFIFAPSHRVLVHGYALSSFDFWQTPLGNIEINQEINKELVEKFDGHYHDEPHREEHAIEVQVPFIQHGFEDVKIIPVLIGDCSYDIIAEIIDYYWGNEDNAFVVSSDLSHYYTDKEAKKIDSITAQMIENLEIEEFKAVQACGSTGVCSLAKFAKNKNHTLIRVGMVNSGDIAGEKEQVVGYGSWMLFDNKDGGGELGFANFIKKYFAGYAIAVCKKSIIIGLENHVENHKFELEDLGHIPPVFDEYGACFVTLRTDDEGDDFQRLRGCVGSIIAHRPLIEDLIHNAYGSAFSDTRFPPLTAEEFKNISISISILSTPKKIEFDFDKGEEDLLSKIVPDVDGIIIKEGLYQAVYLPSVWEDLPDKKQFLNSLKQKAGLSADHFSKTFEAYRFRAQSVN